MAHAGGVSSSSGPDGPGPGEFLYDEDPMPLHTGSPRGRRGLIGLLLGGTVLVAVAMAYFLPLVLGSATKQSEEVATVFVAALQAGDTETAYGLLCDDERGRVQESQLVADYLQPGTGTVVGSTEGGTDGAPTVTVEVRWVDGGTTSTTELTVIPENGARICGIDVVG